MEKLSDVSRQRPAISSQLLDEGGQHPLDLGCALSGLLMI
jgi:hypothetical protein